MRDFVVIFLTLAALLVLTIVVAPEASAACDQRCPVQKVVKAPVVVAAAVANRAECAVAKVATAAKAVVSRGMRRMRRLR